ncbi:MAG: hypothetical protein ACLPSL_10450 [Smithella sp.]
MKEHCLKESKNLKILWNSLPERKKFPIYEQAELFVTPMILYSEVSLNDNDHCLKYLYKKGKAIIDFALKEIL